MKKIHKTWKIVVCALGVGTDFFLLGLLTGFDGWFPYMHGFNAACLLVWYALLFFAWERKLTRRACLVFLALVVLTALPHGLGVLLVYSSWICMGISVAIAVWLCCCLFSRRCAERFIH